MDTKNLVLRILVMAIFYMVAMYFLGSGETKPNLLKLGVQGLIFALIYGLAIYLLYKFRKPKK